MTHRLHLHILHWLCKASQPPALAEIQASELHLELLFLADFGSSFIGMCLNMDNFLAGS